MKIKKNDNVIIIAGKDKGKTGNVLRAFPTLDKVLVEGVNKKKKNQRATKSGQKGQIIEKEFPIHVSNVAFIDPKTKKATRIGKKDIKGKMERITKKSGAVI
ncbi:MAG: 50S ribosomal protein L24 [Candidatus Pacebacteria bacterium]|nr:50S ribosomal protein L24 [Candidatus Paceibacterota bacterium]